MLRNSEAGTWRPKSIISENYVKDMTELAQNRVFYYSIYRFFLHLYLLKYHVFNKARHNCFRAAPSSAFADGGGLKTKNMSEIPPRGVEILLLFACQNVEFFTLRA